MTAAVTLRRAGPEDAYACAAILNGWINETPWMPRVHPFADILRHYREFVLKTRRVMIAMGARPLGFLGLDEAEGFITSLFIDRAARGRGVGKRLLDEAKTARPQGLSLWTFVANRGALRFYAREGFVEAERTAGDNEEGLPDIRLSWRGAA